MKAALDEWRQTLNLCGVLLRLEIRNKALLAGKCDNKARFLRNENLAQCGKAAATLQ